MNVYYDPNAPGAFQWKARFDRIMLRGAAAADFRLIGNSPASTDPRHFLSDHFGILATVDTGSSSSGGTCANGTAGNGKAGSSAAARRATSGPQGTSGNVGADAAGAAAAAGISAGGSGPSGAVPKPNAFAALMGAAKASSSSGRGASASPAGKAPSAAAPGGASPATKPAATGRGAPWANALAALAAEPERHRGEHPGMQVRLTRHSVHCWLVFADSTCPCRKAGT